MDIATQTKVYQSMGFVTREQTAMLSLACPEGKTPKEMEAMDSAKAALKGLEDLRGGKTKWISPNSKQLMMRKEAKESAVDHKKRMSSWSYPTDKGKILSWTPVPTPAKGPVAEKA